MPSAVSTAVMLIAGMRDNACRERVAEALVQVEGVVDVEVSLIRGRASVRHNEKCKPAELIEAVKQRGYDVLLHSGKSSL
ncbi:MAG TPA: heavy metal-associated domain-containing protein [Phycisphaerales bacterium]|nr:heavy metal-associated domain-containing protein [Phycisphaerales bacterium]